MVSYNISPSSLNLWLSSPLQFFYQYIMKLPPTTPVNQVYGLSGIAVHAALEQYHIHRDKTKAFEQFRNEWERNKLDSIGGYNNKPLSYEQYKQCVEYGMSRIDADIAVTATELKVVVPLTDTINKKGIIDIVAAVDGVPTIVDWKTSSTYDDSDKFRIQTLFYAHLYWCSTKQIINKAKIIYLKLQKDVDYEFTTTEITQFSKNYIEPMLKEITANGDNPLLYAPGLWDNPFNPYKSLCEEQVALRNNTIIAVRRNNQLTFVSGLPKELSVIINELFSYKMVGYQFTEAHKLKGWDGSIRFLKHHSLPYAFIHKLQDLLVAYNAKYDKQYSLTIVDKRDKAVVDKEYATIMRQSSMVLRPYQEEAVEAMLDYRIMIMHGGVGSGKSLIISEFLRRCNKRSLVLINKIELVNQLADDITADLGIPVGKMLQGVLDIDKQITIATPQTIAAILERNNDESKKLLVFLYNVTAVIYDECHLCFDGGLYRKIAGFLKNVEYSIGLSGSPFRNNNDTLEMNAMVGFVQYKKLTDDLQKEGFVVPVRVQFITIPSLAYPESDNYHEQYDANIVDNVHRNKIICSIAERMSKDKSVLILVNRIRHGELLSASLPGSFFLHGGVDMGVRKQKLADYKAGKFKVLIGMMKIMGIGINIPRLEVIINAAAQSSRTDTIQYVGRASRLYEGKDSAMVIDFLDESPMFKPASIKRIKWLRSEGYDVMV